MNKILTSYNCECGCNKLPSNLLKITAGNDFSIELQLTEKVGDEWVHYDMTDMENVTVSVMSPNNTPTEIDSTVDDYGNIVAIIDAQKFKSYVIYGIEVLWQDNDVVDKDKRAYAPHVFAFVNSSVEATDSSYEYTSDSPYEYNIRMQNDIAIISLGKIPEVDLSYYYTKDEIDETLSAYVTNTELSDMSYATQSYVQEAVAGVTIDESNLVHKTGDERIFGRKTFGDRILGESGFSLSGDLLAQGAGVSHKLPGLYVPVGVQTARLSSNEIWTSQIIGPHTNSEYTTEERDAIIFSKNTANNESQIILQQMAKIDSDGIYEGTTLLSDKYQQIANMPSIPEYTSDLTNDSGFITNAELSNMSYVTSTELSNASYVTSSSLNSTLVDYVNGANYDSTNHLIQLTHDSAIVATIDAAPFIIDGMVDTVTISNGYLVISFNTDAGKQDISIPITDIFDANDYYTKMQVDDILQSYVTATQLNNAGYVTSTQLNNAGYVTAMDIDRAGYLQGETDPIFSASAASGITSSDISSWNSKQDELVSGTNIKTINNESILGSGNITIQGGGGGTVPDNVVTSYDGTYIYCLSQSDYDTLEQNQQLDTDTFYYITDATSNYVTSADLSSAGYVTSSDLSNASYVTSTELSNASYATVSYVETTYGYLDTRVTYLEQNGGGGGTVPDNVVTSYDGTYIYCISQSDYDEPTT